MCENAAGVMVRNCWHDLPDRFDSIVIDALVVMPNHLHGVIFILRDHSVGTDLSSTQDKAVTRAALH